MQVNKTILSVSNLSISFVTEGVKYKAVDAIDFSISAGETLAIVGESGSGKSVSSLCIMGLLPKPPAIIESGIITFGAVGNLLDLSVDAYSKIRGKQIAMIFQEPMTSLNPLMTCGAQVAESFVMHLACSKQEAKQKTIALFEEVKIPNAAIAFYKYPHEMSGGQKQRVMIAMALSGNPQLLIADEPTTALDVSVQQEIIELLQEIQTNRGTAILFITHDLAVVKNIAHRVLVMLKGKSVEYNDVATIFNNPEQAYTKALIACRPNLTQRLKQLPTIADIVQQQNNYLLQIETKKDFLNRQAYLHQQDVIIEIKNATIKYPTSKTIFGKVSAYYTAIENLNLSIKNGETIGIVGESGCGKTTLGKALVKLNPLFSGEINYLSKNINTEWGNSYHRNVQIIFQDPYSSLNPRITIGKAIEEPMHVHNIGDAKNRKKEVTYILQKVGLLPEHYDRYPHEFSGGQRQRICIARALGMQAKVIICDESVSALDASVQAQVLNLLCSLRQEFSLTLLFISHDMNVIRHISDRIIVMQKGKIVEEGSAYQLFENPQDDYTKMLLNAVPKF
jgi:peptide/nickel transport system ATP-binding protein